MRRIEYGLETMLLHPNGCISRPSLPNSYNGPSGQWKCVGAVRFNNFGYEVEHYSLEQILNDPASIQWKHGNGKQRVHIQDLDHGSFRVWMSPGHQVY